MREWRKAHPLAGEARLKMNCRTYLHIYIKRGKVKMGDCCEVCFSTENLEAHHPNYRKPLIFNTLCRSHRILVAKGVLMLPAPSE
jgi:hypothetical protein